MRRTCWRHAAAFGLAIVPAVAFAQDLSNPTGREWLTVGGDWHNTRHSTLTQVNRDNVENLKAAWVIHLGSGLGQ